MVLPTYPKVLSLYHVGQLKKATIYVSRDRLYRGFETCASRIRVRFFAVTCGQLVRAAFVRG